jgi:UDPglucose 6-dehydrogenase
MIGFIGLSHLGLNYSLATAAKGFEVVAYDPDSTLAARCSDGDFPIDEPQFGELFAQHRSRLRYVSTLESLAECDLIFYSLDVRTNEKNESDLGPLTALIHATSPTLSKGTTAVVLSQVHPGYTRRLRADVAGLSRADFYYQVETLIFGRAVQRAMQPERYIVGSADAARPLPKPYQEWLAAFGCPVLVMRLESAELAKIAINFFLVSSITTTNTLAEICEAIGADWNEIIPSLQSDQRIGPKAYLKPGLGIAGGNLERDLVTVQSIAARHGTEAGVVTAWQHNSAHRRNWVLQEVQRAFPQRQNLVLAVWGLAYKENTHSTKNSTSLELMNVLRAHRFQAHDPVAQLDRAQFSHVAVFESPLAAVENAEGLLVMTPWSSYAAISPKQLKKCLRGNLIIDPYGVLDAGTCRALGFDYHRLGSRIFRESNS